MSARPELVCVSVVGARPQFVKLSSVSRAMARSRWPMVDHIVHTGQHYDDAMSHVFFQDLDIPPPAVNLNIGSGPQGRQTGRMLEALETHLIEHGADVVIVYGDTNSTLAGALAAAKLHIPVVHVEAGLRSFNRRMPEELNRIATDHLSDVLCAPTRTALDNLAHEGLGPRTAFTGDVMYDAILHYAEVARERSNIRRTLECSAGQYGVVTLHRAENTTAGELGTLLNALNSAARRFGRLIFPMHPRTAAVLKSELPDFKPARELEITAPVGYLDMLALVQGARWVLTDSGGLQKEAYFLGCPCITLREETEWLETLENGANFIAGADGSRLGARLETLEKEPVRELDRPPARRAGPFGSGSAADLVLETVNTLAESRR
ncbi:MAG TPA: UDP-N-acetylglucosamine 2-epimerase (non-hydrolyzing) [Steroidobacteraceae bacterium]|nr:UDP-N-acetylglucosamine 2-epimerase (non-hydrolyzing) [Steroidobacteraceae bacterium]